MNIKNSKWLALGTLALALGLWMLGNLWLGRERGQLASASGPGEERQQAADPGELFLPKEESVAAEPAELEPEGSLRAAVKREETVGGFLTVVEGGSGRRITFATILLIDEVEFDVSAYLAYLKSNRNRSWGGLDSFATKLVSDGTGRIRKPFSGGPQIVFATNKGTGGWADPSKGTAALVASRVELRGWARITSTDVEAGAILKLWPPLRMGVAVRTSAGEPVDGVFVGMRVMASGGVLRSLGMLRADAGGWTSFGHLETWGPAAELMDRRGFPLTFGVGVNLGSLDAVQPFDPRNLPNEMVLVKPEASRAVITVLDALGNNPYSLVDLNLTCEGGLAALRGGGKATSGAGTFEALMPNREFKLVARAQTKSAQDPGRQFAIGLDSWASRPWAESKFRAAPAGKTTHVEIQLPQCEAAFRAELRLGAHGDLVANNAFQIEVQLSDGEVIKHLAWSDEGGHLEFFVWIRRIVPALNEGQQRALVNREVGTIAGESKPNNLPPFPSVVGVLLVAVDKNRIFWGRPDLQKNGGHQKGIRAYIPLNNHRAHNLDLGIIQLEAPDPETSAGPLGDPVPAGE